MGSGYDDEFVKRMGEVVTKMELDNFSDGNKYEKPDMITLVCKSDYVCEKCPNRVDKRGCSLGNRDVLLKDRLVLKYLGLEENKSYTLDEIRQVVGNIKREQFEEICGGCRWYKEGYCRYEKL